MAGAQVQANENAYGVSKFLKTAGRGQMVDRVLARDLKQARESPPS